MYKIRKPDLVKIVADSDLPKYVTDFQNYTELTQQLLYIELPKYKNCCDRDWKALKPFVEELVRLLKTNKENAERFKEYMFLKYNVPHEETLEFFFRGANGPVFETF